jgi:hypothetical protein
MAKLERQQQRVEEPDLTEEQVREAAEIYDRGVAKRRQMAEEAARAQQLRGGDEPDLSDEEIALAQRVYAQVVAEERRMAEVAARARQQAQEESEDERRPAPKEDTSAR